MDTIIDANIMKYNGTITVESTTGEHRTFKVTTVKRGPLEGKRIISLLVGPENENDYRGFGFVQPNGIVNCWKKLQKTLHGKSQYQKYADLFTYQLDYQKRGFQFRQSIRCRVCGRKLTTPDSIESGIGPICARR